MALSQAPPFTLVPMALSSPLSAFLNLTPLPRLTNTLVLPPCPVSAPPGNLPLTLQPAPHAPALGGGSHKSSGLRPPVILSRGPGPPTRPGIRRHPKTTSAYPDVPDLVHGTRQVAHLVQEGPELGQGHLDIGYPVGTARFHMWGFTSPPSASVLRPDTCPPTPHLDLSGFSLPGGRGFSDTNAFIGREHGLP